MRLARRDWRPQPLVLAIIATIGAAVLVFYLQQRAMTALQSQNQVIVRQLAEQTAADIAVELRRTLDGPIFDTLAAVNHPELRAGRLDLVAQHFGRGPRGLSARRSVLRLDRADGPRRVDDRRRAVLRPQRRVRARPRARSGGARPGRTLRRHAADLHRGRRHRRRAAPGAAAPVLDRCAARVEYFAVLGFVVDPASMRQRLFAGQHGRTFDARAAASRRRRAAAAPRHRRHRGRRLRHAARRRAGGPAHLPDAVLSGRGHPARASRPALPPRPWAIEVGAPAFAGAIGRRRPALLADRAVDAADARRARR